MVDISVFAKDDVLYVWLVNGGMSSFPMGTISSFGPGSIEVKQPNGNTSHILRKSIYSVCSSAESVSMPT